MNVRQLIALASGFVLAVSPVAAKLDNSLFAPDTQAIDVTIYQLQFGGLYFPGGKTYGGFASGVLGLTRLEPDNSAPKNYHPPLEKKGRGHSKTLTQYFHMLASQ